MTFFVTHINFMLLPICHILMFMQPKNIKICLNGNNIKLMCATKKTSKDPQILLGVIISPCSDDRTICQDGHILVTFQPQSCQGGHILVTTWQQICHSGHGLVTPRPQICLAGHVLVTPRPQICQGGLRLVTPRPQICQGGHRLVTPWPTICQGGDMSCELSLACQLITLNYKLIKTNYKLA